MMPKKQLVQRLFDERLSLVIVVFVLFAIAIGGACGFRFRGSVALPPSLAVSMLQDSRPPSDLAPVLRQQLIGHGIKISDNNDEISAVIILNNEQFKQHLLSSQSSSGTKDYQLNYSIEVGIRQKDGKSLLDTQTIVVTRELGINENQYLAGASELDRLRQTMVEDGVRQIFNRIRVVK